MQHRSGVCVCVGGTESPLRREKGSSAFFLCTVSEFPENVLKIGL